MIVFDEQEYEQMRHYESARNRWVAKYGTLDFFEQWYALDSEVRQIELNNTLRDIASTRITNSIF